MIEILLRGGTVADGTGAALRRADVAIADGRVLAVEPEGADGASAHGAARVIDVSGRLVVPGFVDIHTHSDLTLLADPGATSKVRQGVTTEVVGNCGLGLAPLPPGADRSAIRAAVGYLDLDPKVNVTWSSFSSYLDAIAAARPALNVASLVAHLPIHAGVVGFGERPATPAQRAGMCALLDEALRDGGVGLSTGLAYAPLCFADEAELVALADVVADHDRIFAWHALDYGDGLVESVQQALRVARRTGVRTQISHLTAVGRRNWSKIPHVLDLIDRARLEGLDVGVDLYPYTAGNAPLSQLLPGWAQVGGNDAIMARLADRATRTRILEEWAGGPLGWDEIILNAAPGQSALRVGWSIARIGEGEARDGGEVVLDLLQQHGGAAMMVAHGRSEDNVRDVLSHPASVVASDGQALDPDGTTGHGLPHPRSYGTFPRYLHRYAGDDLADAVRRCTSAPADRVRLDRGRLVAGAVADVVVIDLAAVEDRATFQNPHTFSRGIDLVIVGGRLVVDGGAGTGARPGDVLTPHATLTTLTPGAQP